MGHLPPYKSETKAVVLGAPMEFLNWIPELGPGGGRNVIDRLIVCLSGTITVATANFDGRDVPRFAQQIVVEQVDGTQRWNLSGYKSRIASIDLNGIESHQEHAAVVIGAGQAVDLRLIIPLAKPKSTYRDLDFSLAGDVFRKVAITWATLGAAATGATVLTVPALNAYILAETHEEDTVEMKAEDVVKSVDFNSTTQASLSCVGVVHDLLVVKEDTTAGGAVITAITDARIETLGLPLLTRGDLVHAYRAKRQTTACGPTTPGTERFLDPVQEGKALPIITADKQTSLWDGKLAAVLKIDLGTGLAGSSLISREVKAKSQANINTQLATWRVDPTKVVMKVTSQSKRALGAWKDNAQLVGVWEAHSPRLESALP